LEEGWEREANKDKDKVMNASRKEKSEITETYAKSYLLKEEEERICNLVASKVKLLFFLI